MVRHEAQTIHLKDRGSIRAANLASASQTPGVHQIINLEKDNAMRLLAVGIAYPDPGRYIASTRPARYEIGQDNARVRAWRLKLNPGESAPTKHPAATRGSIHDRR